jgi:antiviral helicase SKI2
VDAQAVPPQWPPTPESLLVDQGVYELVAVPLSSIALFTNRTIKVSPRIKQVRMFHWLPLIIQIDLNAIVEQHKINPIREAIAQLKGLDFSPRMDTGGTYSRGRLGSNAST